MKPVAYKYKYSNGKSSEVFFPMYAFNECIRTPLYAIPAGYKLVPLEPTEEMLVWTEGLSILRYKAMIEAAPSIEDIL